MDRYGESYYHEFGGLDYHDEERWEPLFRRFAEHIVKDFAPETVLDVGCAFGYVVKYLRELGVQAWGIDNSHYAVSQADESICPYLRVASACEPLPDDMPQRYDMVLNIEVLEHLTEEDAKAALKKICTYTDTVLFSSTGEDFDDPTHINVQQPEYWAALFVEQGFYKNLLYNMDYLSKYAFLYERADMSRTKVINAYERTLRHLRCRIEKEQAVSGRLAKDVETIRKQNVTNEAYFRGEISRLTEEVQQHIQKTVAMSQRVHELQEEQGRQQEFLHVREGEIGKLETQSQALSERNGELQKEREQCQETLNACEESIRKLSDQSNWLTRQNQELVRQKEQLEQKRHEWTAQAERLEGQNCVLLGQLQDTRLSLQRTAEERDVYCQNARHYQAQLNEIIRSRGYRTLIYYCRLRDWLLPRGSRRRKLITRLSHGMRKGAVAFPTEQEEKAKTSFYSEEEIARQDWCRQNPLDETIRFSILTPAFNTPIPVLEAMIFSVKNQIYTNWELCIVDASPDKKEIGFLVEQLAGDCDKIKYRPLPHNGGISENTIAALEMATGDFIALLDHDDLIAPNALYEYAACLKSDPQIDFFYSDKDMIDETGTHRMNPFYKPNYAPEMMYSANYLTHFCVIRTSVLKNTQGFETHTDGAQDWDIFLKVMEQTDRFWHVDRILYHWRILSTSVASGAEAKPYALDAQLLALSEYVQRRGWPAEIYFQDRKQSEIRVKWRFQDRLRIALFCLSESGETAADLPEVCSEVFSCRWSDFNRLDETIRRSEADVLLFVDADVCTGFSADIVTELSAWAMHPEIGFAAPQLRAKNKIVSCGLIYESGRVMDLFADKEVGFYGQMGHSAWYRNLSAFRSACLAIQRTKFLEWCQYQPEYGSFALSWNCFAMLGHGLRNVYDHFAWVEVAADFLPSNDVLSGDFGVLKRHMTIPENDPYMNRNCTIDIKRELLPAEGSGNTPVPETLDQYASDALALASIFRFSPRELAENQKVTCRQYTGAVKTMVWFLQEFDYVFYAGLYTIFRTADYLRKEHGILHTFVFIANTPANIMLERIGKGFPELASCQGYSITTPEEMRSLPGFDASVCTLWTTAYYALKFNRVKRKFYFIQDYEPLFYPAGSTYAQAEATYRFGFYGITNTRGLQNVYQEEFQGTAVSLDPSVDTKIFYPNDQRQYEQKQYTVFFYGRPGHPRNGFELGAEALKALKKRMGSSVRIVTAGANYSTAAYGLDGVVENLGRLKVEETGDLYRRCDAGLVMMYTRHPSYLPYELMACGCCVVSNYNAYTSWFLKDGENAVVCEASADCIAEGVEGILRDGSRRKRIAETGVKQILYHNPEWHESLEKVARFIQNPER